jgi:folate-dependent phosphoribosylglycinamide formyltransferase PurN
MRYFAKSSKNVRNMINKDELNIIYLGTEGNMQSCLALEEIIRDGWKVRLVVGYIPYEQKKGYFSITEQIISFLKSFLVVIMEMKGRRMTKVKYENMQSLLLKYDFQLVLTSDKSLKSVYKILLGQDCDVLVSNGWQYKITKEVYNISKIEALNCHPAYLPEYRGGNVTYAPLINEEKESGVTVHKIVDRFDSGMILAQERVPILKGDTPQSLSARRALITSKVLIEALSIAGEKEKYKINPSGPFYFSCKYRKYKKYRIINWVRKLLGLPIKKYTPKIRYDI